jgi:hypothetical protein
MKSSETPNAAASATPAPASWSIGEVTRRFGQATNVLRHWEDVGLLRPDARRAQTGTSVGTGIGLIAAGAILYWAVDLDLPFVFDGALGVILMVAGVIAVLATVTMQLQSSRSPQVIERRAARP